VLKPAQQGIVRLDRFTPKVKLTIGIICHDEHPYWIRRTVIRFHKAAPEAEILVCDDASTNGCCQGLPGFVRVVRNHVRRGTGGARLRLQEAAEGDVVAYCDSHVEQTAGSIHESATWAWLTGSIVLPQGGNIKWGRNAKGYAPWTNLGGRLIHTERAIFEVKFFNDKLCGDYVGQRLVPISGLVGACYIIPKYVSRQMGGWIPTERWGFNDIATSIQAFMAGVPIYADRATIVLHRYGRVVPYPIGPYSTDLNRCRCLFDLFAPDTFQRLLLPRMIARTPYWKLLRYLYKSPSIQAERARFQQYKVRSDAELWQMVTGDPPPMPSHDAHKQYGAHYMLANVAQRQWQICLGQAITKFLRPCKSVFDLGCGSCGVLWGIAHAKREIAGCDLYPGAAQWAPGGKRGRIFGHDASQPIDFAARKLAPDVIVCTDVAEHMASEAQVEGLAQNLLASKASLCVLSASCRQMASHTFIRDQEWWAKWMQDHGWIRAPKWSQQVTRYLADQKHHHPGVAWRATPVTVYRGLRP